MKIYKVDNKMHRVAEIAFTNSDIKNLVMNTTDAGRQQLRLLAQQYTNNMKQALTVMGQLEANVAQIEKLLEIKIADPVRQVVRKAVSTSKTYELLAGAKYSPENIDALLNAATFSQIETRVNIDVGQATQGKGTAVDTQTQPST